MSLPDHHGRRGNGAGGSALTALAVLAAGAAVVAATRSTQATRRPRDDAPRRTAHKADTGSYALSGNTVTINRPRAELYSFWRDFSNLSGFMENVESIETRLDGTSTWTIAAPAGQSITIVSEIVEEREGELIVWRSTEESTIRAHGRVTFRDAPAGRGSIVEAIIAYEPPAGELGKLIAKLFQKEPKIQGRRDLRRFKMLMETGEVATAASHKATDQG